MGKVKLTKNELKLQRDALKRFQRYLPTLQLKKQQLQLEVRQAREELAALEEEDRRELEARHDDLKVFGDYPRELEKVATVAQWRVATRNIAGIEVPAHRGLEWRNQPVDLLSTPIWLDDALALVAHQTELRLRRRLMEEQLACLEDELRVVNQRVNLFEKVKIPDAQENIRRINIYIGDQQTNSVGRSKIAKGKCQERDAELP
ncbi:MAG: V-type ATP synthase subunit D [Oligosphaeraceae bacterium]